ncbi:hypothetical protein [Arthrobacter sp. H-02-3]|uniref:hypothetical protein n=1 Tax=Arthrobacter sp. H-02-3 TaxID=2703675 RepID=UPI000DD1E3C2|nr:hypothetical protein [Arthrobacter sp. H-02-3]PVZ59653.1 hypothetical protein C9424_05190 [Arthrobacter sp. H-02-3]
MSLHDQSPSPSSPEQEEILRLRAEVARLQRERDDARTAPPKPSRTHPGLARRIVAIVLVVLTAVFAIGAVPALYLRSEVLDTDHYVATVAPLASDPAIQAEIADKVTQQITDAVDIQAITRDALNELSKTAPRVAAVVTGLAPVIAEQTKNLIHTAVSKFVATPQFQDLWIQVNRVAHQSLVNLATGNTGGTVSIDQNGTVTISTKEIIARVKTLLVQQGVGIAERIPEVDAQIALFQSPELVRATTAIRTLDQTAPILAWLTVISAVGAIAVAPRGRRRSTTSGVGLAVAVAMALLALGLVIGRSILLNSIPPDTVSPAAAQSLVETLLVPLRTSVRLVFAVGLLIALAAFLTGHSRPAEFVRHGLATAGDYINGKVGADQVRPWQLWLARYRRILDSVIIGTAVLVLIFWQDPTAAVAIWTAVFAVLAVLLVELLCRPAVAPGAEAVVGTGAASVGFGAGAAPAPQPVSGSGAETTSSGAEPAPGPASGSVTAGGPPEKLNPTLPIPRKTDSPED